MKINTFYGLSEKDKRQILSSNEKTEESTNSENYLPSTRSFTKGQSRVITFICIAILVIITMLTMILFNRGKEDQIATADTASTKSESMYSTAISSVLNVSFAKNKNSSISHSSID